MFLGFLIFRDNGQTQRRFHRKSTDNEWCLYTLNFFAPDFWNRDTYKTLILRLETVCSKERLLQKGIKYLKRALEK